MAMKKVCDVCDKDITGQKKGEVRMRKEVRFANEDIRIDFYHEVKIGVAHIRPLRKPQFDTPPITMPDICEECMDTALAEQTLNIEFKGAVLHRVDDTPFELGEKVKKGKKMTHCNICKQLLNPCGCCPDCDECDCDEDDIEDEEDE